jgi:hypothetical protein
MLSLGGWLVAPTAMVRYEAIAVVGCILLWAAPPVLFDVVLIDADPDTLSAPWQLVNSRRPMPVRSASWSRRYKVALEISFLHGVP